MNIQQGQNVTFKTVRGTYTLKGKVVDVNAQGFITVISVTNLVGQPHYFMPLMLSSTVISASQIISN